MSTNSKPQYARVTQPFGCAFPDVHCPICGRVTIKAGEDGPDPTHHPCKHLAFIFVKEVSDFEYKSADFVRRTQDLTVEQLDADGLEALLAAAGYGNQLLAIQLTHGGMGCGPMWFTEVFGFDYGTLAD